MIRSPKVEEDGGMVVVRCAVRHNHGTFVLRRRVEPVNQHTHTPGVVLPVRGSLRGAEG